ncbi:ISAs1 family transposase [Kiloniella sp.]|uniref:ISAs1 family transposase n=1 Tax=Kiloniella sp. TaxID=1938587 RepID=UPI003B027D95
MRKSERPSTSRFSPLAQWQEQPQPGHGRIDQRHIELLPANALSQYMRNAWPTIRTIARVTRNRQDVRAGNIIKSETETTYLISSMVAPTPETILRLNRNHWQIEIMHRDKDVTMGEDRYTNRSDHAPRNIFSLTSAAITLLKRIAKSPTKAIEMVQDNRGKAVALINGGRKTYFL